MKITWTNKDAQKRYEADMTEAANILRGICTIETATAYRTRNDFVVVVVASDRSFLNTADAIAAGYDILYR